MDQISPSPGRAVTAYASQLLSESQVELRRSQRLMEKESRLTTKAGFLRKAGSPQLFEETDEEWSQPLCQQKPLPQIVHQEQRVAVKRRLSSMFVKEAVPLKRRKRRRPSSQGTRKKPQKSISLYHELQRSQSEVVKSASQYELRDHPEQRPATSEQSSLQLFEEIDAECSQLHSTQVEHLKPPIRSLYSSIYNEDDISLKQLKAQTPTQGKTEHLYLFKQDQGPCASQRFGETVEEQPRAGSELPMNCTHVEQDVPIKGRKGPPQARSQQPEVMQEQCPSTASPIEDSQLHLLGRAYKDYSQRATICEQQEDNSNVPQKVLPLKPSKGGSSTQGKNKKSSTFERYESAHHKQSRSKLPPKYPAHFLHQLPPLGAGDRSYMHMRPRAAPAVQLREMCPTPELTPVAGPQKATVPERSLSPPNPGSESSGTVSLSDSIGEIFGTKNISCILNVESPRQYILIEDHLPAMAMMLNVELVRLRAVLDLTQRLTHEQILNWPLKLEKPTKD
ncbi:uncharacterized protein LOC111073452 [Drosophila obscura]|uniref:uncharacterized protein LOC111073452 n=1 Tax=Drosophila obscura TaxID=7282 RepID=UPI001BB29725|nr:uncharacterized protein LOC111073452 [Drosophila obscura]